MSETPKYYFPESSEFHLGFEYEMNGVLLKVPGDKKEWAKVIFGSSPNDLYFVTNPNYDKMSYGIRVKCLDREDIESCGWDFSSMMGNEDSASICWIENSSIEKNAIWLTFRDTIQITDCRETLHRTLFSGIIKNISELKFQMKRLNIIK